MNASIKKQAGITAVRLLAASPKTRNELRQKLAAKGYDEMIIREALDGLEKQGILSDRLFAQNLAGRFVHSKPSGSRRIGFELKRRGVPARICEEILASFSPEEEIARARELARERWERHKSLDADKRRKRVYDFLIRRGFDFQTTRDVMEGLEAGRMEE